MKKFLVLTAFVALVTGAAVAPAHAVIAQLWTEASLDGGPFSTNPSLTLWPGLGSVEFTGLEGVWIDTSLGTFSLGSFHVNGSYGATYGTTPDPLPFTMKLIQSSPLPGGIDTIGGSLSGSFGTTWSTLGVTFTDNFAAPMDGYFYTVYDMTDPLHYDPASIDASMVTPEPSTLLLVGTGLTSLAGVMRRKFNRRKQVEGPEAAR